PVTSHQRADVNMQFAGNDVPELLQQCSTQPLQILQRAVQRCIPQFIARWQHEGRAGCAKAEVDSVVTAQPGEVIGAQAIRLMPHPFAQPGVYLDSHQLCGQLQEAKSSANSSRGKSIALSSSSSPCCRMRRPVLSCHTSSA